MTFSMTILPANPCNVTAGETVHLVATPVSPVGAVTYWWQEYIGSTWTNVSGWGTTATLDYASLVGTTKIRVAGNDTATTAYSTEVDVIATSVYTTFGAGLTTIHTDLGNVTTHLSVIRKAVE